ncbi:SMI1/KNR4 family protein [Tumebacillus sp. DT12]|uniref:SMI1/KNR4 family protein n=1 Tax=Tumebacillus lacus TaxID=2995335 RepID=A0ABT3WVD3_9BACL|nr:SMI1/KNR4 family protein [Tumebacillus lacus]MCX7568634.1 SMI1/KNR4 family protein [Tumebacillus lacus]
MNSLELKTFIQKNADDTDFTGGIPDEHIKSIEEELGVRFPESYKWFLRNFGSGGLFGVDILGCGKSTIPSVISYTERLRQYGLPEAFIVIEDCDEFYYCLDTRDFSDTECPVISWDRIAGFSGKRADHFHDFFVTRLVEAKENWEEEM